MRLIRSAGAGLLLVLTAGLAGPLVGLGAAAPARRDTGLAVRLLDAPARSVDPREFSYIIDRVGPGAVVERRVQVTNDTPKPLKILLYASPARLEGGGFVVGERGARSELSDWVTVTPPTATVPARTSVVVRARIVVPEGVPDGERYGAVVAEVPPTGAGVGLSARAAIRIYLSVGTGPAPVSDFDIPSLVAARQADGVPAVRAKVRNTGQLAVDIGGSLSLTDGPGGTRVGPFPASVPQTLAPGATGDVVVPLPVDLPDGPWRVGLDLRSGAVERRATAEVTFPRTAGTAATPVAAVPVLKQRSFVGPVALGALLLAGLGLALVVALGRPVRRGPGQTPTGPAR